MSTKQGIHKWHRLESTDMVVKCIVHLHITVDMY